MQSVLLCFAAQTFLTVRKAIIDNHAATHHGGQLIHVSDTNYGNGCISYESITAETPTNNSVHGARWLKMHAKNNISKYSRR